MLYVAFVLIFLGIFLYSFNKGWGAKNYYLGKYFYKMFGLSLYTINMICALLNLFVDIKFFSIIIPFLIAFSLTKLMKKNFEYEVIKDDYYTNKEPNKKERNTVRGIILNDKNEVALIHLVYDDPLFEYRDHYELPGGGVEANETNEEALKREMEEEIGVKIKDIHYLSTIGIEYNPFNRIDKSAIYVAYLDTFTQVNYQGLEKEFIKGVEWININKLIKIYDKNEQEKVGKMIYSRDSKMIKLFKKCN